MTFITNYNDVATSPARATLLALTDCGIQAVSPRHVFRSLFCMEKDILSVGEKSFDLSKKRIFVIGAGKASAEMAVSLEHIVGARRITGGLVITHARGVQPQKIKVHYADHPIPSERGILGAEQIFSLKEEFQINKDDFIVALISGGGSALMPYPVSGITLEDKKALFSLFLERGISGAESTIIKTKLSRVKGGGLAAHFYPTPILSLVISDDNGEAGHHMTASGPMVSHPSTYADALAVIRRYGMIEITPPSVRVFLEKNRNRKTRKQKTNHVFQTIIARNEDALMRIKEKAEAMGFDAIVTPFIRGEAREKAGELCRDVFSRAIRKPTAFIYGGETTVSLRGSRPGIGGRNQEFVSACLEYLRENTPRGKWTLCSVATDGVDFIQESAGGIIDNNTLEMIRENPFLVQRHLERHDTHPLLKRLSANIVAKPTGTNVGDIILFAREPA